MRPYPVLLSLRRPISALLASILMCGGALLLAPQAAAQRASLPAAVSDTTGGLLAWASQVGALRRRLAETHNARAPEAAALAAVTFVEARRLAAHPLSTGDATAHALLLDAQTLYERYHGPVAVAALSREELGALRGSALAALPGDLLAADGPVAGPVLPSTLLYPASAEAVVAREEQRLLRIYGGTRGIARRTRRHFPMIEQALAQRGLPEELKYVAFIESGMDTGAVSPAGAVGMWQMLPSTGAMYGLDSLALFHPARSTRAATRFLAYLGGLFDGDWQLALAAYNCGPGRVQGLVRRMERSLGRPPTYWDLYPHLPAETRAYVPRFIAVVRALEDAA